MYGDFDFRDDSRRRVDESGVKNRSASKGAPSCFQGWANPIRIDESLRSTLAALFLGATTTSEG